jgi:hypothetical protein
LKRLFDPGHPTFDEARGLFLFSCHMRSDAEMAFGKHASSYVRADKIVHLEQKFPRSNYSSTEEWAQAIISEIRTELVPAALGPSLKPGRNSTIIRKHSVKPQFKCSYSSASFTQGIS